MNLGIDAWITLATIGLLVVGLIQERLSPDVLILGALVLLLVLGVLEPAEALGGLASPTLVTVAALFVVAAAVRRTGALESLSGRLFGDARTAGQALPRVVGVTSVASAFLNNTPVVALFIPTVLGWARRTGVSPSRMLIPVSYAAIVGGVCTLIGTSTNLVVSGLLESRGAPGFGMFELAWVGVPCVIVALAYLTLIGSRLLPDRRDPLGGAGDSRREYTVELVVEGTSPLVGQGVQDAGLRQLPGLFLVRIERATGVVSPVGPGEQLCENDLLTFAGVVDTIVDLQRFRGLVPALRDRPQTDGDAWILHEAVVSPSSPLVGTSIRAANFRGRYNAAVVAVHRHGERVESKVGDIVLRPGDTLLLEGGSGFERSFRDSADFYLVSAIEESEPPRYERRGLAALILVGVIGTAASGLVPVLVAALAGALGVIALRCVTPGEARRSIDAPVLLVIAGALGLAQALEKTGLADAMAHGMVASTAGLGPVGVLVVVYVGTMLLTELISNNAAAALVFPIAFAASAELGVDPRPFAVAVAVAASLSLATPLGYQTNLMVYGPGAYRFTDFARIGMPLQLLLAVVALPCIVFFWLA